MKVRTCIVCGERFIGAGPYCRRECREENLRIKAHAQQILKREPKKPKIKSDLAKDNQNARKAGLSYGYYKAGQTDDSEWKKNLRERFGKEDV